MSTSRFGLIAIAASAFVVAAAPVALADADDEAIGAAVARFFDAHGKRDLAALADCLGKTYSTHLFPSRDAYLERMKAEFAELVPTKYEAKVKSARKEPGGPITVRVEFKGMGKFKLKLKGRPDEVDDNGQWAITLAKEGGVWKVLHIRDAYADVATAAMRAGTKAERLAIFRAEGDSFLMNEFLSKLFRDQDQEVEAGEFRTTDSLQTLTEEAAEAIEDADSRRFYQGGCLLNRGRNELVRERYDEAVAALEKALAFYRRKELKEWKVLEATALNNLVAAQGKQGDSRKAVATGETVRETVAKFNDLEKSVIEAKMLANLGGIYSLLGDYTQAVKDFNESLRLAEKYGDESVARHVRGGLALVQQLQGRYTEAIRMYEALLVDVRRAGHRRLEAEIMNNIGMALAEQGRSGQAIKWLEDARRLAAGVKDRRTEASTVVNLALVHHQLDANEDAARLNLQAKKLYESVGDKAGVARCLKLIGMLHLAAGRQEDAEVAFAESFRLMLEGGSKSDAAQVSLLLGTVLNQAGQTQKAGDAYAAAAKAYAELGDPVRAAIARLLIVYVRQPQGGFLFDLDELDKLKSEVARLDDHRLSVPYYNLIADLHSERKEWAQATTVLRKAIAAAERRSAGVEDPQLAATMRGKSVTHLYAHLATVLYEVRDLAGVFQASERAKARSLSDMLRRGGGRIGKGMTLAERAEDTRLWESVMAATRRLTSAMRFAANDPEERERVKKQRDEAEAGYEAFRRRLFTDHPDLAAQQGELPAVGLTDLQKALFAREPDLAILSYLVEQDRVMIVVVTAGEKPDGPAKVAVHSVPVKEAELAKVVEEFWKACQNPGAGRPKSNDLWKWLIAPAAKELAGKTHLVIVPFSPLLELPFQALAPDTDRKTPYLIEQYAVSYAPSVSALLAMRRRGDKVRAQGGADRPAVVVGGVNFTDDLTDLEHCGPEAEAVGKALGENSKVLLGARATRKRITDAAPSARILHLATHGIPNSSRPLFSAIAVTPDKDDGRLYGHDITDLDLLAELVVLSACKTAKGREFRGEGTLGLAWAFFVAGSPAVVVSQWNVADKSTSDLMRVFYERMQSSADPSRAESLRQAQLALLKVNNTRHPMFWAPFILTGDWRK